MTRRSAEEPEGLDAAKLAPPALGDSILDRKGLERELDRVSTPSRWVCAPSGSGKSTLVAAYTSRLQQPLLWYRLDDRDNDPSFFFAGFSRLLHRQWPELVLPHFSQQERGAVQAHAAALLQVLAKRAPAILVFDDEHVLTSEEMQATVASIACASLPTLQCIVCSQRPPGKAFYAAIARRALGVSWNLDLALTEDECRALVAQYKLGPKEAAALHAMSGGHAAAAVLACELLRVRSKGKTALHEATSGVHGFLLEQLVARLPEPLRRLLLDTSFLPQLSLELVKRVVPGASAEDLESLADRGLLARHMQDGEVEYKAHDLVRSGARRLAGATEAGRRCVEALQDSGRHDDAFEIEVQLGAHEDAGRSLLNAAPRLLREGRISHLLRCADRLPAQTRDRLPGLAFLCGQAALGLDTSNARRWLLRAYEGFVATSRWSEAAAAAACALIGYNTDMQELHGLRVWLDRFAEADREAVGIEGSLLPLVLLGRVCTANIGSQLPSPALLDEAIERLWLALKDDAAWTSADQRANAARLLFEHYFTFRGTQAAEQAALTLRPLGMADSVSPGLRARWWLREAKLAQLRLDRVQRARCLEHAEAISRGNQCGPVWTETQLFRFEMLVLDDPPSALEMLPSLEKQVAASAADCARLGGRASILLRKLGRATESLARAEAALGDARAAGYEGSNLRHFTSVYALALAANGREDEARAIYEQFSMELFGAQARLASAYAKLFGYVADGRRDHASLSQALRAAQAAEMGSLPEGIPSLVAALADALESGIETSYVRRLIAAQRFAPPPNAAGEWPWAVAVTALGSFSLKVDGRPYMPGQKAQDKPLALLKALVAAQAAGHSTVDRHWLMDQLWPETDAANARKSLDMTVARLRKLLQTDAALLWVDGRLGLNKRLVWSDVQALLDPLGRLSELRDASHRSSAPVSEAVRSAVRAELGRVLHLYRGQFLADEVEEPWILGTRSQLFLRLRVALTFAADVLGGDDADIALLDSIAAVAPEEDLARVLMLRHIDHGRWRSAMRLYDTLCATLRAQGRGEPSAGLATLRQRAADMQASARVADGSV